MDKLRENIRKIFRKALLNEVRILPNDKDLESCPSIYKGVSDADSYIENGFQHQLAGGGGTAVGEGVYARLDYQGAVSNIYSYGPDIVEGKVLGGFRNYIMFDGDQFHSIKRLIQKYYGEDISPREQIKRIVKDPQDANTLIQAGKNMNGHSHYAKLCRKYGIRGLMYGWDGVATVLPFDFSSVIVWAVAKGVRYNRNARLVRVFDDAARERYEKNFDWDFQLFGKYDSYDRTKITIVQTNNEMYALVRDNGRGWNFVKLDTRIVTNPHPREISDIWFRSKPSFPSIKSGIFSFDYMGMRFFATVFLPGANTPALWYPEDPSDYYSPDLNSINDWVDLDKQSLDEVASLLKDSQADYRMAANFNESLKKNFRHFLNEEIYSKDEEDFTSKNRNYIYTATNSSNIPSIFENGLLRQFAGSNDGAWYGEGVYAKLSPTGYDGPDYGKYDKDTHCAGIKSIVVGGFARFLIFDDKWANRVYGGNCSLKAQVYKLFPKDVADDVWADFDAWMHGNKVANGIDWERDKIKVRKMKHGNVYPSWPTDCRNTMMGGARTTGILHAIFDNTYYTRKYTKLFSKYGVKGTIYNGGNDGLCALSWNYDIVVPYMYTKDCGRTWSNDLFNFDAAKERSFRSNDPVSKFRHLYDYINDKPIWCTIGDNQLNVTTIKDHNRWNIININDKNGRKISPIDFDNEPKISLSGIFRFIYKGVPLQGVILLPGTNEGAVWFPEDASLLNDIPNVSSLNDWVGFNDLDEIVDLIKSGNYD